MRTCQNSGKEVYLSVVSVLHGSLDSQHLTERVLVTMLDLEILPCLPEVSGDSGIAHLSAVTVDCAGAIDLTELRFQIGKSEKSKLGFNS